MGASLFPPKLPLRDALPFIGALAIGVDVLTVAARLHDQYGDVFTLDLAGKHLMTLVSGDSNVRNLLKNPMMDKGARFHQIFADVFGQNVFTDPRAPASVTRQQMMGCFVRDRVKAYVPMIYAETQKWVTSLQEGQEIDMDREMQKLTFRIAAQFLFGVDPQDPRLSADAEAFYTSLSVLLEIVIKRVNLPFPFMEKIEGLFSKSTVRKHQDVIRGFVKIIIAQRRNMLASGTKPPDLLTQLIESGLPEEKLIGEIIVLLIAGHETTAHSLTYTYTSITQDSGLRAKLMQEAASLPEHPGSEDIQNLSSTEAAVWESLRMNPTAPFVARRPLEDVPLGSYILQAGRDVVVNLAQAGRDREVWGDNADHFNPQRFVENPNAKRQVLAFGYGPRACLGAVLAGLEMPTVLAAICGSVELSMVQPSSGGDMKQRLLLTASPAAPVKMRAHKLR